MQGKHCPPNPGASHPMVGSPGHHRPRLARVSAVTQTRKLTLMTSRDLFGSACCPQDGAPLLRAPAAGPAKSCTHLRLPHVDPMDRVEGFHYGNKTQHGVHICQQQDGGWDTPQNRCCPKQLRPLQALTDLTAEPSGSNDVGTWNRHTFSLSIPENPN